MSDLPTKRQRTDPLVAESQALGRTIDAAREKRKLINAKIAAINAEPEPKTEGDAVAGGQTLVADAPT